jgi:hypothetical protein
MKTKAQEASLFERANPGHTVLNSTLYELIEAISAELNTHEEDYIAAIVEELVNPVKSNLAVV